MIEELMRNELKDVIDKGYDIQTGYYEDSVDEDKTFFFYLHAPDKDYSKSIYGYMRRTNHMTKREIAFAASYFLLGTLEGRGTLNMEKVTA